MRYAKLLKTPPDLLADEFATCRIGIRQQHSELFSTIPDGQTMVQLRAFTETLEERVTQKERMPIDGISPGPRDSPATGR
jgi:hypothetical protein